MANYKDIHGVNIETVTSNPDNPANGQVWYNSTDKVLRGAVITPEAVASGGNYPQSLYQAGSAGVQTAAIGFGGRPGPTRTTGSYSYNGSSWTNTPSLNQGRSIFQSSFGTSTSAIGANGQASPPVSPVFSDRVEEFNGSAWTEEASTNTLRRNMGGIGATGTSGLLAGGLNPSASAVANTETWNGSSWTEVNDLNNASTHQLGAGTVTAGIVTTAKMESWNGSSWTELTDPPIEMGAGGGQITAIIAVGGPSAPTSIYKYNGSAWAQSPASFSVGHPSGSYAGNTGTAAIAFTGAPSPSYTNSTEHFNLEETATRTFTVS